MIIGGIALLILSFVCLLLGIGFFLSGGYLRPFWIGVGIFFLGAGIMAFVIGIKLLIGG